MRSRPPHSFRRDWRHSSSESLSFARELVCLVSETRTNISSEADHDDVGVIDAMLFEKGDKLFTRIARRQENLKGIFEFNKPASVLLFRFLVRKSRQIEQSNNRF